MSIFDEILELCANVIAGTVGIVGIIALCITVPLWGLPYLLVKAIKGVKR